jgi:hypothetical protein
VLDLRDVLQLNPEHGGAKKIEGSYRTLNGALRRLGFTRYPREAKEFEDLQRKVLNDLQTLLNLLEDRIAADQNPPQGA